MSWQPLQGGGGNLIWVADGMGDQTEEGYAAAAKQHLSNIGDSAYGNNPNFQKLTPQEVAEYQKRSSNSALYGDPRAMIPGGGFVGMTNAGPDNLYWSKIPDPPKHTDNGGNPFSAEALLTGGLTNAYSEQGQTSWNDARYGGAILSLPFVGAGITAGLGAVGAGAAGAGAAGTTEAGAGTLYAGETASGVGSSGVGLGGTGGGATGMAAADGGVLSGSTGSASLVGGAGTDTAASMPAATAEADPLGGYNIDSNTGDVYHGTGDNPFGSNFSGGTGNEGFSGYQPGFLEQAQTQAMSLAKQLGITPASALQQILRAAGRAAPAALGVAGSVKQTDQFQRLADQYSSYGAPYRQRLSDLYADPSSFLKSAEVTAPVQQASDIAAHSLSVGGNPIASGNSLQQLQDYSANQLFGRLGQEKDRLAGFGGLTAYNAAAPGAATNAINSGSNIYNAVGAGFSNVFNPPRTLAQQMADFQRLSSGGVR